MPSEITKHQDRPADRYKAIADVGQLRAMLAGRDDTIAALTSAIDEIVSVSDMGGQPGGHDARTLVERIASAKQIAGALTDLSNIVAKLAVALERPSQIADLLAKTLSELPEAESQDAIAHGGWQSDIEIVQEQIKTLMHSYARLGQVSKNHAIYRQTRASRRSEISELERRCAQMRTAMRKMSSDKTVSAFWEEYLENNIKQLRSTGLSNFKLTVNQNYQNFIPRSLDDPKIQPLLRWFRKNPSAGTLLSYIENPDKVSHEGFLSLNGTQLFSDKPDELGLYRMMVTLGWEYCRANDPLGLCDRLEEPELGNPIRVHSAGKLISQDLATSAVEITDFVKPWRDIHADKPFSVLEIGGGYGRLAHAMMITLPVSKYIIVDIPPALHVSEWYLSRLFPDKKIFRFKPFENWSAVRAQIEKADIVFLLPHQLPLLPDKFVDMSVAVSSLHEMSVRQANEYLRIMAKKTRTFIHSKQYWNYDNPIDKIVVKHDEYILPKGFDIVSSKSDALNPAFFVDSLKRA